MAYSSVRVQFEIGHEASVRNKRTPEGFTHDWEVFVRGADGTDIQYFVEKVVFHLHETFPKPKRVIKEPPYSVKECGYAGFVLPIDVYLKNKEEPKKISFQYDLQLQSSGPPISRILREPRVFQNPSEDFRRKLIRGGGVGVDSPPDQSKPVPRKTEESKPPPTKKLKPELPLSNSFADLFGTPIRRVTPEPKKAAEVAKKVESDKKKISKLIPVKDEREYNREKDKEKLKDREKSKEKPKRPPSPPAFVKAKEERKSDDKEKKKEEFIKSEKERKEKHKEKDEKSHKKEKKMKEEIKKPNMTPTEKSVIPDVEKLSKERSDKEKHKHKHKKKEKEKFREKEKLKYKEKDGKDRVVEKLKRKVEEDREELTRSPSPASPSPPPVSLLSREKQRKGPLGALFSELSDSASAVSDEEDSKFVPVPDVKPSKETSLEKKPKAMKEEKPKRDKSQKKRSSKTEADSESKRMKLERRERSGSREKEREREAELSRRQKEEQERREREAEERRIHEREEEERRTREREEEERRIRQREEEERRLREKEEEEKRAREREREESARKEREKELVEAAQKTKAKKESRKRNREKAATEEAMPAPVELSEEYLSQLRELQHRIMSLEDNAELQKVVKVIAESGQYEVTKKTFDFDLCALDHSTVRRLQDFFHATS